MAVTNFQQTIWSKAIQKELKTITSLRNHCDFQYERETKKFGEEYAKKSYNKKEDEEIEK